LQEKGNLCDNALFTVFTLDGGYAEYTVAYEQYCFPLNATYANSQSAPLLCAGLIGYRPYSMIDDNAENIGIYGFGAAAHILAHVVVYQHKKIFAFTRDRDITAQQFALSLGTALGWRFIQTFTRKIRCCYHFCSYRKPCSKTLQDIDKGGIVVCGGIHMSNIPTFNYDIL
jgi:propanol-preferring alcohol dehydrogenase